MARRQARPAAQREVRLTPLRELWRAALGGLSCPAHPDDVPGIGSPETGGAALSQRRVCVVSCALSSGRRRSLGTAPWRVWVGYHHRDRSVALRGASLDPRDPSTLGESGSEHRPPHRHRTARNATRELVALHLAEEERLQERLKQQGQVILAIDGLQPDVGHEVLWVLRDCLSGEVLLARARLRSTQKDLSALLAEVTEALPVPIRGVISDGQKTIRKAVAKLLPGVPHQLCQFHYLREAAKPIFEADRHAKALLKQQVRGVRPIERALEGREDEQSQAMHGYCLAVRSSLTDDGRPPLCASGLKLHDRLIQISDSLARVEEKRGNFLRN